MKSWLLTIILILAGFGLCHAEIEIVAGAGPSTEIVQLFFSEFSKRPEASGTTFGVMPGSIKHIGGIKHSDDNLFGRTGRPLSAEERAAGKSEIILGRVPISFAGGKEVSVKKLTEQQLKAIYTRKITNWKQLGGVDAPILLAGREATEAVLSELKVQLPWFSAVKFDQVFNNDDDAAHFIGSPAGRYAIIFGTGPQFREMQLMNIQGLSLGIRVGLVYDNKNQNNPLVKAVRAYSSSGEWLGIVMKTDYFQVD